jgi:hypothetical protein
MVIDYQSVRLASLLQAAALPVVSFVLAPVPACTLAAAATAAQIAAAAAICAAFDPTDATALAAWQAQQIRTAAVALIPAADAPTTLLRASHLTVFGVLQGAFGTINALVAAVNALNGGSIPVVPALTWDQVVTIAQQQIASGAADGTPIGP